MAQSILCRGARKALSPKATRALHKQLRKSNPARKSNNKSKSRASKSTCHVVQPPRELAHVQAAMAKAITTCMTKYNWTHERAHKWALGKFACELFSAYKSANQQIPNYLAEILRIPSDQMSADLTSPDVAPWD